MILTEFSFMTALLCFSLFIILFIWLSRNDKFLVYFGLSPLIWLLAATIVRLVVSIELSFTKVVASYNILPKLQRLLRVTLPLFGDAEISIGTVLLLVWAGVSVVCLCRFLFGWRAFQKKVLACPEVTDQKTIELIGHIAKPGVKVVIAPYAVVPYIIGFSHPTIVLPDAPYTYEELDFIFVHEWRHFVNKDAWIKLFVHLLRYLLWWNPLVGALEKQLDQTLELRCDFHILAQMPDEQRPEYYQMILRIYRKVKQNADKENPHPAYVPALMATRAPGSVVRRFRMGLSYKEVDKTQKRFSCILCGIILATFLASYTIVLQPATLAPTEEDGIPIFSVFPSDTYLVENKDGTYSIYIAGEFSGIVHDIAVEPLVSLPIY